MRRREFIALIGVTAGGWPLVAHAAHAQGKVPVTGFLGTTTRTAWSKPVAAFEQRLNELGWIPGRTITIDYHWTEGHNEQALAIAQSFVQNKVDVIVVGGNGVAAAKQATSNIPIVFPVAVDPVGSGFVVNLSHPGGNVTGLSLQGPDVAGKRLELLRAIVPSLRRLAIMVNVGYPAAKNELTQCQAAAQTLGIQAITLALRQGDDITPAFESLNGGADALYVVTEALTNTNHVRIGTLALGAHLPTMFGTTEIVESGGLMAYGPSLPALFRRAADFVDKILHGVKPGDIPVEQPTKFELAINMTTAKALGVAVPSSLLAIADQVIE